MGPQTPLLALSEEQEGPSQPLLCLSGLCSLPHQDTARRPLLDSEPLPLALPAPRTAKCPFIDKLSSQEFSYTTRKMGQDFGGSVKQFLGAIQVCVTSGLQCSVQSEHATLFCREVARRA